MVSDMSYRETYEHNTDYSYEIETWIVNEVAPDDYDEAYTVKVFYCDEYISWTETFYWTEQEARHAAEIIIIRAIKENEY